MSGAVPFKEAMEILAFAATAPGCVRAVRPISGGSWGPQPFFIAYPKAEAEAEVTFCFAGGEITGLTSIRIADRFSNDHDWIGEAEGGPYDELERPVSEMLRLTLFSAAARR